MPSDKPTAILFDYNVIGQADNHIIELTSGFMEENQSFSGQKKIDKGFAVLANLHSSDFPGLPSDKPTAVLFE